MTDDARPTGKPADDLLRTPDVEVGDTIGARLAQRDEEALAEAYRAYGPVLLRYLTRYVGRNEAEDVLQRTFLDAWRNAATYDPRQRLASWLFTIAHHRAVDALRAKRAVVVDVETLRDLVGDDGRETAERFADAADVHRTLRRLPEHERVVLELAYFVQLTQREIAERLGLPLGTVKARAARGTRRLGQLMRDEREGEVR
ncbi:RNA polymerase sigma factor [Nocardioides sp. GXQ0305]|uniref:RNA polymerase sigma factor n=1 Tax=Nocardioides sp. GXQ0305 TaxID=3423912 RepID=UPI003D7E6C97